MSCQEVFHHFCSLVSGPVGISFGYNLQLGGSSNFIGEASVALDFNGLSLAAANHGDCALGTHLTYNVLSSHLAAHNVITANVAASNTILAQSGVDCDNVNAGLNRSLARGNYCIAVCRNYCDNIKTLIYAILYGVYLSLVIRFFSYSKYFNGDAKLFRLGFRRALCHHPEGIRQRLKNNGHLNIRSLLDPFRFWNSFGFGCCLRCSRSLLSRSCAACKHGERKAKHRNHSNQFFHRLSPLFLFIIFYATVVRKTYLSFFSTSNSTAIITIRPVTNV